jgi:hypothetical protein
MPIIDAIMGVFQGLIDFLKAVFTGDWKAAWEAVVNIFRNIIDGIVAIFKFPINLIITGINTFLGGLNKLKIPDWVPGIGGKGINIPLIPMLAKGSDSAPDTFIAGEAGPELITNAKGSKVFTASETFGIFDAIKKMASSTVNPEGGGGIAQGIKDLFSLGATPSPDTVAAATSGGDNITIIQHNDFQNTFNGDRAGQKKSAEAMDEAQHDTTGELARALAYVRA